MKPVDPSQADRLLARLAASRAALIGAFVLTAFGVKLWLLASYANATPFWDEWDAIAANTFVPYVDSKLSLQQMFVAQNEHRMVTMHLLSLALLAANGLWDPVLQMIVNAGIHIGLGVFILTVFGRQLDRASFAMLTLLVLAVIAAPFASESLLFSIQTAFYCVELLGCAALYWLLKGQPRAQLLGVALASAAFLSLSAGALVFVAAAAIAMARRILGVDRGARPWLFAILMLVGCALCIAVTPTIQAHKIHAAHSVDEFLSALFGLLGWPVRPDAFGWEESPLAALPIFGVLALNGPTIALAIRMLRKPPPAQDLRWTLLAFAIWTVLILAAIAYGRAGLAGSIRYRDFCALNVVTNFLCLISVVEGSGRRILQFGWLGLIACGLIGQAMHIFPGELQARYQTSLQQEQNVKAFLAEGKFPSGAGAQRLSLPYPSAKRLAGLLSDERVRSFLPSNLQAAIAAHHRPDGSLTVDDRLGWLRSGLLAAGPYLTAAGALSMLFALLAGWRGRRPGTP